MAWCECEAGCCGELPRRPSLTSRLQKTFAEPMTSGLIVGEHSDMKVRRLAEKLEIDQMKVKELTE